MPDEHMWGNRQLHNGFQHICSWHTQGEGFGSCSCAARAHPTAICDSNAVGPGTKIWAFCHVMDGAKIGSNTNIGNNTFIEAGAQIGNDVTIKNNVLIWEGIPIEDQVFVGPAVSFVNDMYPRSPRGTDPTIQDRYRDKSGWLVKTRVEAGASIGASVVIAPGMNVG